VDASTLQIAQTLPDATTSAAGKMSAADKTKLNAIEEGATANATDAQLRDRQTHTGEQAISTITGLATALAGKETAGAAAAAVTAHEAAADPHPGYLTSAEGNAAYATAAQGALASTAIQPGNAALSDAREWTAATIGQAEAEAGSATTRRAFTAERVRQAVVAWWNGATSSFGRSWVALADAAAGTAALNAFSTTLKGLVPAPGTATGKVLSDSGSWVVLGGGGDALVANPLSQFASTTSAQLRGVISDETGTGALVFADSPTLITPALGTPSALNLINATGLPLATGISGLGTGIATSLAVNVGSPGAPVLLGGAGGTPSSLTLTNATGLPTSGITAFNADTRGQVEAALVVGSNISITPGGSGATRTLTIASAGGGLDAIHKDASEFIPSTTAGCGIDSQETATNRVNRDLLLFDPGTQEHAINWFAWPTGWNTAKVSFFWFATSDTGSAVFGAQMATYTDGDSMDLAWGTAQEVTDATGSANTHRQTAFTGGITPAGTVTAGKLTGLRIYRNAGSGSDDLAVDAAVIGVLVEKAS
jgi:hypothetical protein